MTLLPVASTFVDNTAMKLDEDIQRIKAMLTEAMASKKIGSKPLAKKAKLGETTVRDFLKKDDADIRVGTLKKLAEALGYHLEDFFSANLRLESVNLGPRLFVKGKVAAGEWVEAFEWPDDEWQGFTGRSDVTADLMHRFGLLVSGDSMDEIYPPGTIVECVSLFGRAEATPGKNVIVVRKRKDDRIEATVKHLVDVDGDLWLRPRSTNPIHQSFRLHDDSPDIIETRIIAVVVSSVRPE